MQQLLAAVEYQTSRANEAEKQRDGWKRQADEWQGLYVSEKARADLVVSANTDRKEQAGELKTANFFLQQQHDDDKAFIKTQDERIRSLEKSRFRWGVGGAVIGGGACLLSTLPNIFR